MGKLDAKINGWHIIEKLLEKAENVRKIRDDCEAKDGKTKYYNYMTGYYSALIDCIEETKKMMGKDTTDTAENTSNK